MKEICQHYFTRIFSAIFGERKKRGDWYYKPHPLPLSSERSEGTRRGEFPVLFPLPSSEEGWSKGLILPSPKAAGTQRAVVRWQGEGLGVRFNTAFAHF